MGEADAPLSRLARELREAFGLRPVIACEIEFYLTGDALPESVEHPFFVQAASACVCESIPVFKIEAERGAGQFEIALRPLRDAQAAADCAARLKALLADVARPFGLGVSFAARPYPAQPGSGLHVHLHLEDENGMNVYTKQDDAMSDALRYSLGGLLATLTPQMTAFAPLGESYARFQPGANAPTTVSWGANNRTTALRLPDKPTRSKHIEHRVAGSDADPHRVIAAILKGVLFGLHHKSDPGAQIHGDASLPMYALPRLPGSLEEAKSCHPVA